MILAGDVGGTKTILALLAPPAATPPRASASALAVVHEATLASQEFATFEEAVRTFLAGAPAVPVGVACFGVAGPVVEGRSVTTNLPWELDERRLAAALGARHVRLLNDLEATGHGVLELRASALETLQAGVPRTGNLAIIAAGTGLGEALLVWDGRRHVVVASEGGHASFAPRTELEGELLRFLRKDLGHVSYERVLSGPGLLNVYRFLRETSGLAEPAWLRERMAEEDPSAAVSEAALADADEICVRALELFVSVYGAEAGNLALKGLALGGVFVAGGIAPKIRARLADGAFTQAFCDKGRLADLMAAIPVHLVLEPRTALLGAARVALGLAGE
jgi:glucokinase